MREFIAGNYALRGTEHSLCKNARKLGTSVRAGPLCGCGNPGRQVPGTYGYNDSDSRPWLARCERADVENEARHACGLGGSDVSTLTYIRFGSRSLAIYFAPRVMWIK